MQKKKVRTSRIPSSISSHPPSSQENPPDSREMGRVGGGVHRQRGLAAGRQVMGCHRATCSSRLLGGSLGAPARTVAAAEEHLLEEEQSSCLRT